MYTGEKESKNLKGYDRFDNTKVYPSEWGWLSYSDIVSTLDSMTTPEERFDFIADNTDVATTPALDDVYTYKNISKARTQGIELEAMREFGRDFSVKFGYTFLDAKDRNTNKRLEGLARHTINLTLSYNDRKNGWRATVWGDYAWNYLDIRDRVATGRIIGGDSSGASGKTYTVKTSDGIVRDVTVYPSGKDAAEAFKGSVEHTFSREKIAREKNYGLWNLMVEKDITKNATVYAGITNLFNAYDPYLGMAGRIYRLGMRMTF